MIKMRLKGERHAAIREIVELKRIHTQEELVSELQKLGYEVTQATISRDISELGLLKVRMGDGTSIYALPEGKFIGDETEHLRRMLEDFVVSLNRSGNLIVVKTTPGTAQGVASALDGVRWEEVLGTVAGDDTILVVTHNSREGASVLARLNELKSK